MQFLTLISSDKGSFVSSFIKNIFFPDASFSLISSKERVKPMKIISAILSQVKRGNDSEVLEKKNWM